MSNLAANTTDLACSLTDAERKERRTEMRRRLIPHITRCEQNGLNLTLEFDDQEVVRSEIANFVDLERQCCGFLNFVISPPGEKLTLAIDGPVGSQSTLKLFADAAGGSR